MLRRIFSKSDKILFITISLLMLRSLICLAAPKKATSDVWIHRVRYFSLTHGYKYSKAEQRKAERAVLSPGRSQAAKELHKLMVEHNYSDPIKFHAAYTMAFLQLDYKQSRQVLIQYLKRIGVYPAINDMNWDLFSRQAFPDAPEDQRYLEQEDVMGTVFEIYERQHDPVLLSTLLDLAPKADGAMAEGMAAALEQLEQRAPNTLLQALGGKPQRVWQAVCMIIATDLTKPPEQQLRNLAKIANNPRSPHAAAAKRFIQEIRKQQK